jgi:hypothetical protein
MLQITALQKIKTHILCAIFFYKSCCLWDNVEIYGMARQATDDSILRLMCLAIPDKSGYKHTLRICNTSGFSRQQWLYERASMLRLCVNCLSCGGMITLCCCAISVYNTANSVRYFGLICCTCVPTSNYNCYVRSRADCREKNYKYTFQRNYQNQNIFTHLTGL